MAVRETLTVADDHLVFLHGELDGLHAGAGLDPQRVGRGPVDGDVWLDEARGKLPHHLGHFGAQITALHFIERQQLAVVRQIAREPEHLQAGRRHILHHGDVVEKYRRRIVIGTSARLLTAAAPASA